MSTAAPRVNFIFPSDDDVVSISQNVSQNDDGDDNDSKDFRRRVRQRPLMFRMLELGADIDSTLLCLATDRACGGVDTTIPPSPGGRLARFLSELQVVVEGDDDDNEEGSSSSAATAAIDPYAARMLWAYAHPPSVFFGRGIFSRVRQQLLATLALEVERAARCQREPGDVALYGMTKVREALRRVLIFQTQARAALRAWVHLELDTFLDAGLGSGAEEGEILTTESPTWHLVASFLRSTPATKWCLGRIGATSPEGRTPHLHALVGVIRPSWKRNPNDWDVPIHLVKSYSHAGALCLVDAHRHRELGCVCLRCMHPNPAPLLGGNSSRQAHHIGRADLARIVRACAAQIVQQYSR